MQDIEDKERYINTGRADTYSFQSDEAQKYV